MGIRLPRLPLLRPGSSRRGAVALALLAAAVVGTPPAQAGPVSPGSPPTGPSAPLGRSCPPDAAAISYSDALDKATVDGTTVGGLSDLAFDAHAGSYVSTVDNHGSDPARLYRIGNLLRPGVSSAPLVLRRSDGRPYTGRDSDDEGLAVLPDGSYLVSSETEPSVRVFGRDGIQHAEWRVPTRFRVAPGGEATANATLEGLTISPAGGTVVAAMEGTLSGDLPARGGEGVFRRFLVYQRTGSGYALAKQVAYRVDPGMRVPEVAAYDDDHLVVEEASFNATTGNAVRLYAVPGLRQAPDVTGVANLSAASAGDLLRKQLVSDLVRCPTLGATSREPETNPLMDNYEGLAVTARAPVGRSGKTLAGLSLISDDNFSGTQTTRVLNLVAVLP